MSHARETTLTFFIMYLPPLKPNSCALHNFDTLKHILLMFGRNEEEASCKRNYSHFLTYVVISPKAKILCRP